MLGAAGAGCGDDGSNGDEDASAEGDGGDTDGQKDTGGTPGDGGTPGTGDSNDGPGDNDQSGDSAPQGFVACETLSSNLSRVATRVMLLEDKSSSMNDNNKWELAKSAISGMVTAYESQIEFGLDLFPRGDGTDSSRCSVGSEVGQDVAPNAANAINGELAGQSLERSTPLLLAMANYLDTSYAPKFSDGSANSYLVIVSDGADSCGSSGQMRQSASAAELGGVTTTLREQLGIQTIVIGFGQDVDAAQLNAIAAAGGTRFTQYLHADNGDQLNATLAQIAETVVVTCEFEVGTFSNPDVNLDWVNVTMDGTAIGRDPDCAQGKGWMWSNAARTAIEFCTESCSTLESGSVSEVKVELACSENDIVFVE